MFESVENHKYTPLPDPLSRNLVIDGANLGKYKPYP
jgi:hypothetical protein